MTFEAYIIFEERGMYSDYTGAHETGYFTNRDEMLKACDMLIQKHAHDDT